MEELSRLLFTTEERDATPISLEKFEQLSHEYERVAVYKEFSADLLPTMEALSALQKEHSQVIFSNQGLFKPAWDVTPI